MSDIARVPSREHLPAPVGLVTRSDVFRASVTRMCAESSSLIRLLPSHQVGRAAVVLYDAGALFDGTEELSELLAMDARVIVLTRDPQPELTRLAVALGARHFLPTTATLRRVVDTIEGVLWARGAPGTDDPRHREGATRT